MRKLKLQVQMSIDGYMASPNGELDFMTWDWDDELKKFVSELHTTVDCIVMGSHMAPGFMPYWAGVAADPKNPEYALGKVLHEIPKVVFSKTLKSSDEPTKNWTNTTINNGKLTDEINKLKKLQGKDLIVYGGSEFVSNLIKENLIEELYLFINPSSLGEGLKVFTGKTKLKLDKSFPFACGINILKYQPLN
jgi:dihydrofolate reductase